MSDGEVVPLEREQLAAPLDGALSVLWIALALLAAGVVAGAAVREMDLRVSRAILAPLVLLLSAAPAPAAAGARVVRYHGQTVRVPAGWRVDPPGARSGDVREARPPGRVRGNAERGHALPRPRGRA